jgi:hypothetical protein
LRISDSPFLIPLFCADLPQEGSGEFALPQLLAPGAWAREPLTPAFAGLRVPVSFIYGERDWMDWRAGAAAAHVARTTAGVRADLVRIPVRPIRVNVWPFACCFAGMCVCRHLC